MPPPPPRPPTHFFHMEVNCGGIERNQLKLQLNIPPYASLALETI